MQTGSSEVPLVGTILWTDVAGMLESIEIVEYGVGRMFSDIEPPYRFFVDAAAACSSALEYHVNQS